MAAVVTVVLADGSTRQLTVAEIDLSGALPDELATLVAAGARIVGAIALSAGAGDIVTVDLPDGSSRQILASLVDDIAAARALAMELQAEIDAASAVFASAGCAPNTALALARAGYRSAAQVCSANDACLMGIHDISGPRLAGLRVVFPYKEPTVPGFD